MSRKLIFPILILLFGVFMSIPYLVPHCGFFSLLGFVPLLCLEYIATQEEKKHIWWWHYSAFVLWNAITTFWVCNATVGGGIFAVLANAFQMSLVFGLFRFSRKRFHGVVPYMFLALAWIAWERWYMASAQISWPWLVLGNSFARSVEMIQWYEFTGTLGGSLWVWLSNLGVFGLMVSIANGDFQRWNVKAKAALLGIVPIVIAAPMIVSALIYMSYKEDETQHLEVLAVQPNIDPYNKFSAMTQQQQNVVLLDQMQSALSDRHVSAIGRDSLAMSKPVLVVAPETFTNDVIVNDISQSTTFRRFTSFLNDYPNVNLLFGASTLEFLQTPTVTSRTLRDGTPVEAHNSAIITDATSRSQLFHKSKLVVGVEMVPYPGLFVKLDNLLGGVMGRDVGQKEISLLDCKSYDFAGKETTSIPIGCAICYESIYGEYCTGYINKGAKAIAVITNDAWWGDTPGYRQHLSYSALRAIETRRDIIRCANTGISAIINQRGDIVEKTSWWEMDTLRGKINLNDKQTWFVRNGDFTGRICTLLFVLLLLTLLVRLKTN